MHANLKNATSKKFGTIEFNFELFLGPLVNPLMSGNCKRRDGVRKKAPHFGRQVAHANSVRRNHERRRVKWFLCLL